jgi:hypothetical protein
MCSVYYDVFTIYRGHDVRSRIVAETHTTRKFMGVQVLTCNAHVLDIINYYVFIR